MNHPVTLRSLPSGVSGMDTLLGGGIPEFSFNIIAGAPGSGKTTLAHQLMFAHAQDDCRILYFSVLGEPALKMLRYQQQFSFFDVGKINQSVRFVNLSDAVIGGAFDQVLAQIESEVKKFSPRLVFIDSFRSLVMASAGAEALQQFVQRLALLMSGWEATTFLIGEYSLPESELTPVFTVADGIIVLSQNLHRNAMVRKMQVLKIRGQAQTPGWHTFRIGRDGISVFPRAILGPVMTRRDATGSVGAVGEVGGVGGQGDVMRRMSMGNPILDEMLGGGLPVDYSLLVVGPSGSGKSILATQFLAEGARCGEAGVLAAFEKSPGQLLSGQLNTLVTQGAVGVIETRSLDMSIDETLHDLIAMIRQMGARRVVIDSLSGFELALAPEFSEDFRGSLYRMVSVLAAMGVTILMTSELEDRYTDLRFSPFGNAFMADAIVIQRYIEIGGGIQRAMSVIKVRASAHSHALRLYEINDDGILIGDSLDYGGILTGHPTCATLTRPAGSQGY